MRAAWELRFALLVVPVAFLPLVIMAWIGGMSLWKAEDQPILGSKRGELPRKPVPEGLTLW